MDGKFTFVDQRVMTVLGYSPQELLAKPCFDFFHPEDQTHMKESFDQGKEKHCVSAFVYLQTYVWETDIIFRLFYLYMFSYPFF